MLKYNNIIQMVIYFTMELITSNHCYFNMTLKLEGAYSEIKRINNRKCSITKWTHEVGAKESLAYFIKSITK